MKLRTADQIFADISAKTLFWWKYSKKNSQQWCFENWWSFFETTFYTVNPTKSISTKADHLMSSVSPLWKHIMRSYIWAISSVFTENVTNKTYVFRFTWNPFVLCQKSKGWTLYISEDRVCWNKYLFIFLFLFNCP